ncbi:phosphoribosyltransferase [Nonomuraea solani]|uniref:phosphoribosyltransferase n=1 Tax=Nonomuraea solani TaxID=1144553 RepID=UPI0011AFE87D|nr:phosphoribosyltransferase [Nonomuraea solani]
MVPISYAVKGRQHAHALAAYKAKFPAREIQTNLLNLLLLFLTDHHGCVAKVARVQQWTHAAVVPSTRGRTGEHPLRTLIGTQLRFPWAQLTANAEIPPESRAFHYDRFFVTTNDLGGAQVLLLDDTWTTGARVQSASYALKRAGAARVAAIVLGRHVNPGYDGWKPILELIKNEPYRQETCAVHV